MCSKSFLFILACQLVRHDTEACFFAVLYFPWNICHAILKKRRGYNHGWLLGWFAIWMEGILLTTVPLSGMYVYTWLFNILTEKYSPADDISQRLLSLCDIIPSSNIWGTILRLCKSLQKVDFHGTLFQFLSLQSSMSTSLPSIPSVYCIFQIWLQILTNEPKPEWNWDSKSSQFAIEPDTQIPSPGQVPFLLNSPFSAQSSRNLWVPLPCSPSSTSSPTSSPPPIVAHIDPPQLEAGNMQRAKPQHLSTKPLPLSACFTTDFASQLGLNYFPQNKCVSNNWLLTFTSSQFEFQKAPLDILNFNLSLIEQLILILEKKKLLSYRSFGEKSKFEKKKIFVTFLF